MLEKYRPCFAKLSPDEVSVLCEKLGSKTATGEELWEACERAGLMHAEVVLSLARETGMTAVSAIEKLIGKPIVRPTARPHIVRSISPRAVVVTDRRIIAKVQPNPKRSGSASYRRYEAYREGMTVAEALAAGVTIADIRWDSSRGFITLEDA